MAKKKQFPALYSGIERIEGLTILYTDKGEYSTIYKIVNPTEKYCADIDAFYAFNDFLLSLVKILGEGHSIQKQDVFCKQKFHKDSEELEFLSNAYFRYFNKREYTEVTTYLIITQERKKNGLLQFDKKKWTDFHLKIAKVNDLLKNSKITHSMLSVAEAKEYIYRYFSLSFEKGNFNIDNFKSGDYSLKIGDKDVRCISLVDVDEINLPSIIKPYRVDTLNGNDMPSDIMSFLSNVPDADCIIYNQVIIVPNQRIENGKLTKKKNRHASLPDPANNLAVEDITKVQELIARESKLLLYTHFNIIVTSKKNLYQTCNFIENELYKSGITASKSAYNQFELYINSFPGHSYSINPNYDRFLTLEDAAACLFYKEHIKGDENSNLKIYYTDRQGVPIGIDLTGKEGKIKYTTNSNFFELGPSGSGKSFHMNSVVRQLYEQNTDIVMVDTGHSYEGLCSYLGGKYITYSETKPISMNPFRITKEEYNVEKTNFLKSLIFLIWKGAGGEVKEEEDELIDIVLSKYYSFYFDKFSHFTEEEKSKMRSRYLLEYRSQDDNKDIKTEIERAERKKLVARIQKLEYVQENGVGGEKTNAKQLKENLLNETGYTTIEELLRSDLEDPEILAIQYIDSKIEKLEEKYSKIRVDELSFNSFYEFALQIIPIISREKRMEFDIDKFSFLLEKFYRGGKLEKTLNENLDTSLFDEKFIVFEIDAIKDDPKLFPIVTLIIMDVFIQKMRLKENRKALIIEEAWKAIASPLMADYIKYLYKTVRKFWGIVGVVTQELDDIIGNETVKDAIINNSEITILLDQSKFKERYAEIAKLLGLSEVEQRKIWTINSLDNKDNRAYFKEVYIRRGVRGDVFGVEEPPECYMAYTTERIEKDALKKYINKYGDIKTAISEFCKDWKNSGCKFASDFATILNKDGI